jgi:peroxiredoxin
MSVAVAFLGILCLVNLGLLFAVVRKVRVLGERVDRMPPIGAAALLPVGSKAPEFTAVTTAGQSRSLADLAGSRAVLGFFSPGCEPCRAQLPEFIEFAKALPGGPGQALGVVLGQSEAADALAAELGGATAVVITPRQGPLATAFSVRGTPAFYLISPDGQIEARSMAVRALAATVPA